MAFVVEVQRSVVGHLLPPVPRHPLRHTLLVSSQTRPDSRPPQSASVLHPHWPFGRQAPPLPLGSQFWTSSSVHSPQVCCGVQTWLPAQSALVRHGTQTPVFPPGSKQCVPFGQVVSSTQPLTQVPVPSLSSLH